MSRDNKKKIYTEEEFEDVLKNSFTEDFILSNLSKEEEEKLGELINEVKWDLMFYDYSYHGIIYAEANLSDNGTLDFTFDSGIVSNNSYKLCERNELEIWFMEACKFIEEYATGENVDEILRVLLDCDEETYNQVLDEFEESRENLYSFICKNYSDLQEKYEQMAFDEYV